jgi:hypothetical protein
MADHSTQRRRRPGSVVLIPLALLASSAVVYQASNAAFTATTANPSNSWASGTVALTDNDAGAALFTASGIKPGDGGTKCIVVTYTGSIAASVKLYATGYTDNGLGQYLTFSVDEGTGTAADCSDFSSTTALYSGTLDGFATGSTAYASGLSGWAPAGGSNATRTFRFSWTLQDTDNAQGKTSAATFTWEARSS